MSLKYLIPYNLILISILCLASTLSYTQEISTDIKPKENIERNTSDSSSVKDVEPKKKGSFFDLFEGKPGKAALYSLVLPGAGQAYNRRYWKIPLALGAEGFFIYRIVDKKRQFNTLDKKWRAFLDGSPLDCDDDPNAPSYSSATEVKTDRDNVRQDLEYAWVFWGLSHLVVTLEAFVDRHLIDFDIDEDLSIQFKPETYIASPIVSGSFPAISIKYTLD